MEKNKKERVGILYTGGKDSHLALAISKSLGVDVKSLVSIIPLSEDSYMFHKSKENLLELHSEYLDIPIEIKYTEGKKEEELEDLKKLLKRVKNKYKIDSIVSGAIESTYQSTRINLIAKDLGLKVYNPLWLGGERILNDYKKFKIKPIFIKVSAYPLNNEVLIKNYFDYINFLKKNKINVFGEGGEFETYVLSSSFMKKEIVIKKYEIKKCGHYCYYLDILDTSSISKKIEEKKYEIKYSGEKDIIIVDLNTNPLGTLEFSYPLYRIFKGTIVSIEDFINNLNSYLDKVKLIIFSGVPLLEFDYEKYYKNLDFIEKIEKNGVKAIGICAGAQLIAKYLDIDLIKYPLIGIKEVSYNNKKIKTYFLTHYVFDSKKVKPLFFYKDYVVGFKYKNFLALAFHIEYNILSLRNITKDFVFNLFN